MPEPTEVQERARKLYHDVCSLNYYSRVGEAEELIAHALSEVAAEAHAAGVAEGMERAAALFDGGPIGDGIARAIREAARAKKAPAA